MRKREKKCRRWIALLLVTAFVMSGQPYQSCGNIEANAVKAQTKTDSQEKIVERTETSTIYDLGNGKKKAEIYSRKVRFTDDDGELRDYDTSLVRMEEKKNKEEENLQAYAYQTRQSDKMAYFPEKLTDDTPVLTENEGYQAGISPVLKKDTKKKTGSQRNRLNKEKVVTLDSAKKEAATSVEYENIAEDTVFQYEATNNGLKENIVLERPAAGNKHSFCIRLKNCCIVPQEAFMKNNVQEYKELRTKSGESLYLYDAAADRLAGCIPAAFMYDAEGNYSGDCSYAVKLEQRRKTGGETIYEYKLTVIADEEYLEDPERAYPVTIDPTVTWNENVPYRLSSAYVCATAPNATYTDNNTNILCVGKREQASDVCRAYIRFNDFQSVLKNKNIESASLTLATLNTDPGINVYVRQVTSAWENSSITYKKQPSKAMSAMGNFVAANSAETVKIPLAVKGFNDSALMEQDFYGIELTDSENDQNIKSLKTMWIYNSVSINTGKIPKLEIVYNDSISFPQVYYSLYNNTKRCWSDYAANGDATSIMTTLNIRAIRMTINANGFNLGTIKYRALYSGTGWTDWVSEGAIAGDVNQNHNLKAIQVKLYNSDENTESSYYDIYYRSYTKNKKWVGWAKNGEYSGEDMLSGGIAGMQVVIVPKLLYRIQYLSGGSQYSTTTTSFPNIPISVGKGYKIYGIGVRFADINMCRKHVINTVVYKESGKAVSGSSNTSSSCIMIGGDANDCITGLRMQFTDADMSSHFDIEHMVSTVGNAEEEWKKNTNLSGSTNRILEMMSVRIVPKDYDEGARACDSDEFLVSEDGFAFINTGYDFGYLDGYKIPEQKYIDLYGVVDGHDKYVTSGNWSGSCYGMVLTSQLFFQKMWKLEKFQANSDCSAESTFGFSRQRGRKSTSLTDLIEYAQISWWLNKEGCIIVDNVSGAVSALAQDTEQRYVMSVWKKRLRNDGGIDKTDGHAVVPLKVLTQDGNNYKILLYDPNFPGQEKYATYNATNNAFSYNGFWDTADIIDVYELYRLNEVKMEQMNIKSRNPSYNMQDVNHSQIYSITVKDCALYSITDDEGNDIHDIEGADIFSDVDGNDYTVYHVPRGQYKIFVKDAKKSSRISIMNQDASVSYCMMENGLIDIVFNQDKTIQTTAEFNDDQAHDVVVETYDKYKNKKIKRLHAKEVKVHGVREKSVIRKVK